MSSPSRTRVHILDSGVMLAALRGDVAAYISNDYRVKVTGTTLELNAREARQLAYSLCEAADQTEREP